MTEPALPVAAILLAAGDSMRMGSLKPLLKWRGESFLDRQVKLYQRAGCAVYTVLGRRAEEIAKECPSLEGSALLRNPAPEQGMFSSLRIAIASLPKGTPAAFFTPVDNPGVAGATVAALLQAWRRHGGAAAIPRFDGRRGHPVLIDAGWFGALLEWPADGTARDFLGSRWSEVVCVDVQDAAVTLDIDTPEDFQALAARGDLG